MVRFFIPREEKFFDLFEQGAQNLVEASQLLVDLVEHYESAEEKVEKISELEHKGDNITHQIMEQLYRSFVTPLDQEDITLLAQRLDDVMDFIEGAASAMLIYDIAAPTQRARELAGTLAKATEQVSRAIPLLRRRSQMKQILGYCVEINRLENESDRIIRSALAELFHDSINCTHPDFCMMVDITKWREIYEYIENAADRCEDIANVLEGVVLKHA